MLGKIPLEICQFPLGGKFSVPEQVNNFFESGMRSEIMDIVPPIRQFAALPIN